MLDTDLAQALGMKRVNIIRTNVIEGNREELESFGGLSAKSTNSGPRGGRPGTAYYLNEAQALLVCTLSRTPIAKQVRAELIRDRGDMVSLTDMWKAAGEPDGRGPSDWRALSSSIEFANHVGMILNAGKSGNELFKVNRGGRSPGTFAHWQIALAYAKYLSPEFHMWCNEVVRSYMEGDLVDRRHIEDQTRDLGISKATIKKITALENAVHEMRDQMRTMASRGYSPTFDFDDWLTVGDVLDIEMIPKGERRALTTRVTAALRTFAASDPEKHRPPRRTPNKMDPQRRWRFHVALVQAWLVDAPEGGGGRSITACRSMAIAT